MIEALADAARAIDASRRGARRDPVRRGQGVLRRRRHRRLGRPAAARNVARLDARRASRLRGAGAAARAADRRADRPRLRRRPGTGGGRRHPHRRERESSSACRRSGLGMAPGWSGTQRLVRRFGASVVRRMALAGVMFTAEEALALGLVDEVTAAGEGVAARRGARGRYRQARPGRRADRQGDDQRRRGRGPRRADRRPRRRADRLRPRISPRASPRSATSARRNSPAAEETTDERQTQITARHDEAERGARALSRASARCGSTAARSRAPARRSSG